MVLRNYFKKPLILFFIFCMGYGSGVSGVSGNKHNHSTIPLFNKNICRDAPVAPAAPAASNNIIAYNRRPVYYVGSHRVAKHYRNPYAVVATDVLRKYFYIVNVVVIYIILYSL
jgi:hypothetical protein